MSIVDSKVHLVDTSLYDTRRGELVISAESPTANDIEAILENLGFEPRPTIRDYHLSNNRFNSEAYTLNYNR